VRADVAAGKALAAADRLEEAVDAAGRLLYTTRLHITIPELS
jgi:hypothetical protein